MPSGGKLTARREFSPIDFECRETDAAAAASQKFQRKDRLRSKAFPQFTPMPHWLGDRKIFLKSSSRLNPNFSICFLYYGINKTLRKKGVIGMFIQCFSARPKYDPTIQLIPLLCIFNPFKSFLLTEILYCIKWWTVVSGGLFVLSSSRVECYLRSGHLL